MAETKLKTQAIAEEAFLTATPTVTATSGSFTSVAGATRYRQVGKIIYISITVTITTKGTAAGAISVPLPVNCVAAGKYILSGREKQSAGKMLQGEVGTTAVLIFNYDNTFPGADGYVCVVSGFYEAA